MEAIVINQLGPDSQFKAAHIQPAVLQSNEVTVAVHAFSINPMDIAAKMGLLRAPFIDHWSFPLVLGWDFAGVITKIGPAVTDFKVGTAVFGTLPPDHAANNGSYSTQLNVPADLIAPMISQLSFDQAAALPIAGGTAYQAMVDGLQVQAGEHVLIQGGAGGVGLFAIQIAKARGAIVSTTASPAHTRLLTDLGADQVIDYHQVQVADVLHHVDAVFDTVGEITSGSRVLKSGGRLVSIGQQPTSAQKNLPDKQISFQFSTGKPTYLRGLAQLFVQGQLKIIEQTLPFSADNVTTAQQTVANHHMTGKFVIHVQN